MLGAVTARNFAEAERRFFETWLPDQPVITRTAPDDRHSASRRPWRLLGALRTARS
jgi:hypothetical protein